MSFHHYFDYKKDNRIVKVWCVKDDTDKNILWITDTLSLVKINDYDNVFQKQIQYKVIPKDSQKYNVGDHQVFTKVKDIPEGAKKPISTVDVVYDRFYYKSDEETEWKEVNLDIITTLYKNLSKIKAKVTKEIETPLYKGNIFFCNVYQGRLYYGFKYVYTKYIDLGLPILQQYGLECLGQVTQLNNVWEISENTKHKIDGVYYDFVNMILRNKETNTTAVVMGLKEFNLEFYEDAKEESKDWLRTIKGLENV